MSLVVPTNFQHILRVLNTNIDGKRNIMFAMTAIKGIGRRYANIVLKKVRIKLHPSRVKVNCLRYENMNEGLFLLIGKLPFKANPSFILFFIIR